MPDRENVIYYIERCICHVPDACRDCSHYGHGEVLGCMEELLTDALALLKEQEALIEILVKDITFHNCNNCNREDCESKPNPGQPVRTNCIYWLESR